MQFATKLLLALSGTLIVAATSVITIVGNRSERLLEEQLVERLQDNAHNMLDKIEQYIGERCHEINTFTARPAFVSATASPGQITENLREFLHRHPEYLSAAFYTVDRVVVTDTAGQVVGEREDPTDCWADLGAGQEIAVCAQRFSPGDSPAIFLAVLVRDGPVARGVVILRLPMRLLEDRLGEFLSLRNSIEDLRIDLLDRKGVFLYSNEKQAGILREISPDWNIVKEKISAGQTSGYIRYTNLAEKTGGKILVYAREPGFRDYPGSGWTLSLEVPTRVAFAPVRELRLKIAAVPLIAGLSLLTVLFLLVRAYTRPIKELGRAAREIGKGNLEVRVPIGSRDELGLLAVSFNRMAADLQESQREVVAAGRKMEGLVEERTAELLHTNVLLHAELSERVKAQEALALGERLLRLNADIGDALTLRATLPVALQRCAGYIVRDLDAAFVRIWTTGGEKGVLELKASAGMYTRLDGQHSRKIVGELKIGIIAQEQRPILTNAVIGDSAITDQEWARREGMVAFAGHPLIVDGKTVGVVALFSRRPLEPFVLTALETVVDKIAAFIGRTQAEELLLASEQRYRELFESSRDGIYVTDAAGVFTSINPAGARILGYAAAADIIGRSSLNYWRDPADREVFREKLLREKSVSAYPIQAKSKDGAFVELEASSRILEDENGDFLGIEGVLRDVTQRVRAEAEQGLLIAQLQEAAANIRTLSGLLPICAGCKKIRDDQGRWNQLESFVSARTEAEFSHGLCPDCQKVYFPGFGPPV